MKKKIFNILKHKIIYKNLIIFNNKLLNFLLFNNDEQIKIFDHIRTNTISF